MIEIRKNHREVIRVRKRLFKGQPMLDARVFFPGPDNELRPSAKGVTVSLDRAGDLAEAIRKVAAQSDFDDAD
jgi:hypothetical protein